MTTNSALHNRVIAKIKRLSDQQIQQVENFIDLLDDEPQRDLTIASAKLSEPVLDQIWDNSEDADYDKL